MQLTVRREAGVLLVRAEEARLDAAAVLGFKDRLRDALRDAPPRVVLDLGAVEFLDSSGLGAVVAARKFVAGGVLELAALTPAVARVFRLTRMDTVFTIHPDPQQALAAPA